MLARVAGLACAVLAASPVPAVAVDYVRLPLAGGFDFPVGKPDGAGYYKARGFTPNGHLGEDWNGKGGGNTDLGDSVFACGDGIVVQSKDVRVGWGNVIIIRHAYRESDGSIGFIDSLYGHLNARYVTLHQRVSRGQRIGTIGTNRGMYLAHLHFEIRKNLYIGMHRSKFSKSYENYHSPTSFIGKHRNLQATAIAYQVPINTFQPYPAGSSRVVTTTPRPGVSIAKVEQKKTIRIPIEQPTRYATKTPAPRPNTDNTTRYKSTSTERRTLSPATQRIVAEERRAKKPPAATEKERGGFWLSFRKKVKSQSASTPQETRKPVGRRRGLLRRR